VSPEQIETAEGLGILADAAPRHVEPADRETVLQQPLRGPRKKAPVLEALEAVHDHHERARIVRGFEVAADQQAFVGFDRELHGRGVSQSRGLRVSQSHSLRVSKSQSLKVSGI
jgi:hypothetical protein